MDKNQATQEDPDIHAIHARIANAINWAWAPEWATHYRVIINGGLWESARKAPNTPPENIVVTSLFGVTDEEAQRLPAHMKTFTRRHIVTPINPRDERETERPVFGRGAPTPVQDGDLRQLVDGTLAVGTGVQTCGVDPPPNDGLIALGSLAIPQRGDIEYAKQLAGEEYDPSDVVPIKVQVAAKAPQLSEEARARAEYVAAVLNANEARDTANRLRIEFQAADEFVGACESAVRAARGKLLSSTLKSAGLEASEGAG